MRWVLKKAELDKQTKYADMISKYGAKFTGAALETTGGFSKGFRDLIQVIMRESINKCTGWDKEELIKGIINAVAVAVQVGNARIIKDNRYQILKRNLKKEKQEKKKRRKEKK